MTSRKDRRSIGRIVRDNGPKNPHEEIMDCIESTNDIVSKILEENTKAFTKLFIYLDEKVAEMDKE